LFAHSDWSAILMASAMFISGYRLSGSGGQTPARFWID